MKKILTVVIPTYNMEKYLSNCLDSFIYDEKTKDIEVLIVNDGSKDNSVKIAKEYEEQYPNIFKLIDKENGGHGSTINVGLKIATGKYFKVVDADDWVDTKQFKQLIDLLKNSNADCISCNYNEVYELQNKIEEKDCCIRETGKIYDLSEVDDYKFIMHSMTFKTELIKDVRLQEKCFYVDVEYNIYCYSKCKTIQYSNLNIYQYRLGRVGQSVSVQGFYKHRDNHRTVINNIINFYNYNLIDDKKSDKVKKYIVEIINFHYNFYLSIYKTDKETKKELIDFDEWLKEFSDFYTLTESNKIIRSLRQHNFKNMSSIIFVRKIKSVINKIFKRG